MVGGGDCRGGVRIDSLTAGLLDSRFEVESNDRGLSRKGERAASANPVRVGLAGDQGHPHEGKVNFINNQVDATTGTIQAR